MRIIQLLPTLAYGDGVGNDTLALDALLKENGYETAIYAENIDRRISKKIAFTLEKLPALDNEDIIIYHLSTGTELNYKISELKCRKIVVYHNVTPPEWFSKYNGASAKLCADGLKGVQHLAQTTEYCLADSEFNKEDLVRFGYNCDIDVLPIVIPFEDYDKKPNEKIIKKYQNDGFTNIIFTGRIAPNKKQEDVIRAFYYYKKYYNNKSRLFLVGSYTGMENYHDQLCSYIEALGAEDVYFSGHIPFDEILAYYHLADVFLCMSEHEGFCIPLVEAMYFDIPIIAYSNTGITGTLGGAGVLLTEKDMLLTAGLIDRIVKDKVFSASILERQKMRLKDFDNQKVGQDFIRFLNKFIHQNNVNK